MCRLRLRTLPLPALHRDTLRLDQAVDTEGPQAPDPTEDTATEAGTRLEVEPGPAAQGDPVIAHLAVTPVTTGAIHAPAAGLGITDITTDVLLQAAAPRTENNTTGPALPQAAIPGVLREESSETAPATTSPKPLRAGR